MGGKKNIQLYTLRRQLSLKDDNTRSARKQAKRKSLSSENNVDGTMAGSVDHNNNHTENHFHLSEILPFCSLLKMSFSFETID